MKKTDVISTLVTGSLLTTSLLFTGCEDKEHEQSQPNIILIFADDLGYGEIGYTGAEFYETPHIDELARQGMIFNQFYPSMANCAPTRACLLTGMYSPRHGVYLPQGLSRGGEQNRMRYKTPTWDADASFYNTYLDQISINSVDPGFESLAEMLNKAGYSTARLGKWHIGGDNQGFDLNSAAGERGEITNRRVTYELTEDISVQGGKEQRYYRDSTVAMRLTDAALDFIEGNRDNPFFLYLSHWETHGPLVYPRERVKYYQNKLDQYPEGEFNFDDPEYAAGVEQLDNSVGRVMQKLEELGLEDNTVVIFASDNGGINMNGNNPLRGIKGSFYEGGIRTPFCIKWPGVIEAGTETDMPVIGIDMMPTFAEMASAPLPQSQPVDGESIVPVLKGENSEHLRGRSIYFHFPLYLGGAPILPTYQGDEGYWRAVPSSVIIRGDWKLIHYYEYDSTELFNLKTDISEQNNLASKRTEVKERLMKDLRSWIERVDAPVPKVENENFGGK